MKFSIWLNPESVQIECSDYSGMCGQNISLFIPKAVFEEALGDFLQLKDAKLLLKKGTARASLLSNGPK